MSRWKARATTARARTLPNTRRGELGHTHDAALVDEGRLNSPSNALKITPFVTTRKAAELELLELAYETEWSDREWSSRLANSMRELLPSSVGCYTLEFERTDEELSLAKVWADDPSLVQLFDMVAPLLTHETAKVFVGAPLNTGTTRELMTASGLAFESTPYAQIFAQFSIVEMFAISAVQPSGRGLCLGVSMAKIEGPPPGLRSVLSQIGAHVAAGSRLRQRLEGQPLEQLAEVILRPDGKIEHSSLGDLAATEPLREAARRIERARHPKTSVSEALNLWRALVDGRWSLTDHFESDGRRYYIAVENRPEAARERALSLREAEVVAYIAAGTNTKATAYALGLEPATVRVHLRSALAKLGMNKRAELIELRLSLLGPERDDEDLSRRRVREPRPLITQSASTVVSSTTSAQLPACLSEAERAIARSVASGSSNRAIARARGTSVKTIANQLHRIYKKLGVTDRHELIAVIRG